MTLRDRLGRVIAREGPMSLDRYMDLCLHDPDDGYYATRPALGAKGDFITAPLVSQVFGELLGLWSVDIWLRMGRPTPFRLAELGPGGGEMMSDALRAAKVAPGFLEACELWLVETSPPLRARQSAAIASLASARWAERMEEIPDDAPLILLANEFLDCLPIRQAQRTPLGWRERRIDRHAGASLAFSLGGPPPWSVDGVDGPVGAVVEWSDALAEFGRKVGALVVKTGGAALFVDYGRDAPGFGDTLQALRGHIKECPLAHPGEADLTAHVDFPAFLSAARSAGARTPPIRSQGDFLCELGARSRSAALARARPDRARLIERQLDRLIAQDQMGALFKAAVVLSPGLSAAGFAAPA
jgi:SAM-dependent MidA family methyltransferase